MPKALFQKIVFTLLMVLVMVYGMICYNIALAMGGLNTKVFLIALSEMPIMVPIAFAAAFFLQLFNCGPLVRFLFRKIFEKQNDNRH